MHLLTLNLKPERQRQPIRLPEARLRHWNNAGGARKQSRCLAALMLQAHALNLLADERIRCDDNFPIDCNGKL